MLSDSYQSEKKRTIDNFNSRRLNELLKAKKLSTTASSNQAFASDKTSRLKKSNTFTGQITGTSLTTRNSQSQLPLTQSQSKTSIDLNLLRHRSQESGAQNQTTTLANQFYDFYETKKSIKQSNKILMPKVYQLNYDENFVSEKELPTSTVAAVNANTAKGIYL
jgi:hypothetical protein